MEEENVTGYRLGISYTYTNLRYKPAFKATWQSARLEVEGSPVRSPAGVWRCFLRVRDTGLTVLRYTKLSSYFRQVLHQRI